MAFRTRHRRQCMANLDAEIDMQGAQTLSTAQALWDLRKYTSRWHDEVRPPAPASPRPAHAPPQLGDAAIAALNLHADASAIDRKALIVRVAYIPHQWRRMQRFRLQYAAAEPFTTLTGPHMDAAKSRQKEHTVKNRQNGMVGSALIVLACYVPEVGFIFNSTFVGPEPDLLVDPPPVDWLQRLIAAVRVNEPVDF